MFKKASFEEEIFQSMEKNLVSNQSEQKAGLKRLAQAAEYVGAAAEIFNQAGMTEEAKELINLLKEPGQK
jgi:hypothetical protein